MMRKVIVIVVLVLLSLSAGIGVAYAAGAFDLNNALTWYDESNSRTITESDLEKLRKGMSFEEVVSLFGQPLRNAGSGGFVMEWNMESGKKLHILFKANSPFFNPTGNDPNHEGYLELYQFEVDDK